MATIANRSRFRVTVKNVPGATRHFSYDQLEAVEAYMQELRRSKKKYKPNVVQLDESWLVRIRTKGQKEQSATFSSLEQAERFIKRVEEERGRSLFADYSKSLKVTLAELIVRYLLEESPKHKSHQVTSYCLEGWLADSGPAGVKLLEAYRDKLRELGKPVREVKFQMRRSSDELAWIHKPLADITTVDIESFINDRLEVVASGTVDRDIDRLKAIFQVVTKVWDYALAKNPMDSVRRPKYFNERVRRISTDEEARLLDALAALDFERAVEARLTQLADEALAGQTFTSFSARKKVLAKVRAELRPLAEETAEVVPYLECFYQFQVCTGARRAETMGLPWEHIDLVAQTAFLPETKNGRPRKLALRKDLLALLEDLPRDTTRIFDVGVDYIVGAWMKACEMAGISDLRIHDARHEAISRLAETGKVSVQDLQTFSGHRDLRMLMRYSHLCASRLAKKLDECFADDNQIRQHRGRKYLRKKASVSVRDVVDASCETAEASEATPLNTSGEVSEGRSTLTFSGFLASEQSRESLASLGA
ncbi:site-specific integrase [Rhizobacter sp. SG703]|uniref:site-specific integrase n=1 Tax=Rhizobacter sp. SG703 TaxID=2587140 RepID=UPI0014482271|nr:site-specific integrase [Rhizobacter sp. SG703]NKI93887.1 integrase [Rhizobacter sp. SG703]